MKRKNEKQNYHDELETLIKKIEPSYSLRLALPVQAESQEKDTSSSSYYFLGWNERSGH
jgi:hypothetical protein